MLSRHAERVAIASLGAPDRANLAVLGLGYVGWPVATTYAEAGFQVVGIDVDARCVDGLQRGHGFAPSFALASALQAGRLTLTTNEHALGPADVVFICVPTPLEEGEARREAVRDCASAFARQGRPDALVEPPADLETVALADGLSRSTSAVLLIPQPDAGIVASGLNLFDAPGTLAGAVGV
jgi:hypothetical protein